MDNKSSFMNKAGTAFVYSNVILFVFIYFITEFLNIFNGVTRKNSIISWILFIVAVGILLIIEKSKHKSKKYKYSIWAFVKKNKLFSVQVVVAFILIVVAGVFALNIVPSNWDSMTYHCSRIMNWIQNKSVSYYPTNIPRQLYSPPFAEYVAMHLYFVFKSDIAFNMIQWYAYVANGAMIYLIARKLGICKEISGLGSLLCFTMPIAIAESVTTQTDLFAGMWLLFFVYLIIDFINYDKIEIKREKIIKVIAIVCIVGLGYLSKSQVCLPMLILIIFMGIVRLRKKDKIFVLGIFLVVATIVIVPFVLPSFVRNYNYTGDIFASDYFSGIAVGTYNPRYLLVNILKNWGQTSMVYSNTAFNELLLDNIQNISSFFNVNIDDSLINLTPSYTFEGSFVPSYYCDSASATFIGWIFLGSLIAGIVLIVNKLIKKEKLTTKNYLGITITVAVFAVFAYIRWQPWITRLLIPTYLLMILVSIMVLFEYIEIMDKHGVTKIFTIALPAILVFTAYPAFDYQTRYYDDYKNTKDQFKMYFENRDEYSQYSEIVNYVKDKNYKYIGMYLGSDTYEYPLWMALKNDATRMIQVVFDDSKVKEQPECIIAIHVGGHELNEEMYYLGERYICTFQAGNDSDYSVFTIQNN